MKSKISLKSLYYKHKTLLIIILVGVIVAGLGIQLLLFFTEKVIEEDIMFERLEWSMACEGETFTQADVDKFCTACLENGEECDWPLDMYFNINKIGRTRNTGGEMHCYLIIDDINYYTEKGSFFGVINKSFFTWQVLDTREAHTVELCCGIERQTAITNILGIYKSWPQACVQSRIEAWCTQI